MIKSQKGFTFPLTLSVLMAFLIFFSVEVEQLLIERQMFHETTTILKQEYYMLASVKKVERLLQSGEATQANGKFIFIYGVMDYQIASPSGGLQKITFNFKFTSGESALGFGYYNQTLRKITNWVEVN